MQWYQGVQATLKMKINFPSISANELFSFRFPSGSGSGWTGFCPESKVLPEGSTSPVHWKSPLLGPWSSVVLSPAPPSHQTTRQTNYTPMDPIVHTVKQEHFQSGLNQHLPPRTNWCLQVKEKSCKGSNSCRWQNVTEPARQGKQDIQTNQIPQKEDT